MAADLAVRSPRMTVSRAEGPWLEQRLGHWCGKPSCRIRNRVTIRAERGGQLDPQSPVAQGLNVLIGSPSLIAGKLPWAFGDRRIV